MLLPDSMGAGKSSSRFQREFHSVGSSIDTIFLYHHYGHQNTHQRLLVPTRPTTTGPLFPHSVAAIRGLGIGWSDTTYSITIRGLGWPLYIFFYQTQLHKMYTVYQN